MIRALQALSLALALLAPAALSASPTQPPSSGVVVKDLKVDRLPDVLGTARGEVQVILLYRTNCPACQHVLPWFVDFVSKAQKAGSSVRFFAFATDKTARAVEEYFGVYAMPFEVWRLIPWAPGELVEAFRQAGVTFPSQYGVPYFIVRQPSGRVVDQFADSDDKLKRLRAALERAQGR